MLTKQRLVGRRADEGSGGRWAASRKCSTIGV